MAPVDDAPRTPYPPERDAWTYERPRRSRATVWAAAVVAFCVLVAAVSTVLVLTFEEPSDRPGVVDDDALADRIARACAVMTSTVASLPVTGSAQRQAGAIRDQDLAVRFMVAAIRRGNDAAIGADRPVERWLLDWERLVAARERLADALASDPNASLRPPLDAAGDPIVERMDDIWAGEPRCVVPPELATADNDAMFG